MECVSQFGIDGDGTLSKLDIYFSNDDLNFFYKYNLKIIYNFNSDDMIYSINLK